jgi:hypothetical protein
MLQDVGRISRKLVWADRENTAPSTKTKGMLLHSQETVIRHILSQKDLAHTVPTTSAIWVQDSFQQTIFFLKYNI